MMYQKSTFLLKARLNEWDIDHNNQNYIRKRDSYNKYTDICPTRDLLLPKLICGVLDVSELDIRFSCT